MRLTKFKASYSFQVRAILAGATGSRSSEGSVQSGLGAPPPIPTSLVRKAFRTGLPNYVY